jgi:hypothetical protein
MQMDELRNIFGHQGILSPFYGILAFSKNKIATLVIEEKMELEKDGLILELAKGEYPVFSATTSYYEQFFSTERLPLKLLRIDGALPVPKNRIGTYDNIFVTINDAKQMVGELTQD